MKAKFDRVCGKNSLEVWKRKTIKKVHHFPFKIISAIGLITHI